MVLDYEIKTVDASNLDETGFFCYMSKRKEPGYIQKREWLRKRFDEGMRIKILHEKGGRDVAFIEYIPGEYAWRAVDAPGYMVIHCLWVVGKGKGKGYGSRLIQECINDSRAERMLGVAMLTSDRTWLASKKIFLRNGFREVGQAPPSFQLMVSSFKDEATPTLPMDWDKRAKNFGDGLTVIRTPQCPYIENGARDILAFAKDKGIPAKSIELKNAKEVQQRSPSAYGVFGTVLDGSLLAYQYLEKRDFDKLLLQRVR